MMKASRPIRTRDRREMGFLVATGALRRFLMQWVAALHQHINWQSPDGDRG